MMNVIEPFLKGGRLIAGRLFQNPYKHLGVSRLKIKYLKFLPTVNEKSIKVKGGEICYFSALELAHCFEEIFANKIYEQTFPSGAYIIDCGANIGLSILYFKQVAPDAFIDAFEPDTRNFSLLEKNVKRFNLENVNLHKAAVWTANSTIGFSSDGSMSSRINDVESIQKNDGALVKAVRLKDFMIRKIDFLKIDIEGAEYEVLEDIADKLHFVRSMFVEYHGTFSQNGQLIRLLEIIRVAGFSFYIKEAANLLPHPFKRRKDTPHEWDVQLNIFCIRI